MVLEWFRFCELYLSMKSHYITHLSKGGQYYFALESLGTQNFLRYNILKLMAAMPHSSFQLLMSSFWCASLFHIAYFRVLVTCSLSFVVHANFRRQCGHKLYYMKPTPNLTRARAQYLKISWRANLMSYA